MNAVSLVLFFFMILAVNLSVQDESDAGTKQEEENAEEGEILLKGHLFQDIFMEHLAPQKVQFGHVFENPSDWEQRFEERDFAGNRHQGKVKWGNQNGAYGEHYWDLNH